MTAAERLRSTALRKSIVKNAANVDWESVAEDERHIFVADVGNNFGSRDTLTIYRIPKTAILSEDPELIHDGIITLSFTGEMIKRETGYSNRDCEAILAFGDSLYLFSKDWIEKSTCIYALPKEPGHYTLSAISTYQVSLVGYRSYMPVEGICYDPLGNLLISAEKSLKKQALFRVGNPVL